MNYRYDTIGKYDDKTFFYRFTNSFFHLLVLVKSMKEDVYAKDEEGYRYFFTKQDFNRFHFKHHYIFDFNWCHLFCDRQLEDYLIEGFAPLYVEGE